MKPFVNWTLCHLLVVGAPLIGSESAITSILDVPYKELDGVEPNYLSLDVHIPKGARDASSVVYVHGGSWAFGDKRLDDSPKLPFLTGLGYIVVSVNYRLSSETVKHPMHVEDVADAVAWVGENISNFGGDANAVYLMGHSAGAHLVSLIALNERLLEGTGAGSTSIRGVVLIDTATFDMVYMMESLANTPSSKYHQAFGSDKDDWLDASPIHHIRGSRNYPPFLVLVASPVLMPDAKQLRLVRERKWRRVQKFADELKSAETLVYVVDAMQYKSHRSIERDLGMKNDKPSVEIANFFEQVEALHDGSRKNLALVEKRILAVDGDEWIQARRELGDHSANVFMRFRDSNENKKIESSELREDERPYFEKWDRDKDGVITRDDIIAGYDMLTAEQSFTPNHVRTYATSQE